MVVFVQTRNLATTTSRPKQDEPGAICRGQSAGEGLRGSMVVPGQTDWRWEALLQETLYSACPIILHPRLSVEPSHMTPALTAAKTRDSTQIARKVKVSLEHPRTIKRRHAQSSPVLDCCR